MTELDQVWSHMISEAAAKAAASGQKDIADYLLLKAANDAVRSAGVGWLIDCLVDIAGHAASKHKAIVIERKDPHNFSHGSSTMVGTLLQIRYGVRCLTVEAGWARTPRDGIMRGGALAFARISHFGLPKFTVELRLVHSETLPHWVDKTHAAIDSRELQRHFGLLINE